ncbi:MAG TPA: hypothetical protein VML35_02835 [Gaiellaceae bacterium]|nr:hypothetical protein [Gaiellaceae bacterium]
MEAGTILAAPGDAEAVTDEPKRTVRVVNEHPLLDSTWSRSPTARFARAREAGWPRLDPGSRLFP